MPQLRNLCEDRCLSISAVRAKWAPRNNPGEVVTLTDEQIKLPEVQDFIAKKRLEIVSDSFKPATEPVLPKRNANMPRSAVPRKKTIK